MSKAQKDNPDISEGVSSFPDLKDRVISEILQARERVYHVGQPTPFEPLAFSPDFDVFVKREDLSPIHAYKWRGAYNCTAILTEQDKSKLVVAASAGNHAQGVAIAARKLGVQAKIFMPLSTPADEAGFCAPSRRRQY